MGTLFSSEEQASVDRKSDLADLLILLININESNLRIPLMLAVEILNYAGSLPPIVYQNNAQFRSGNNCDFKYLSVRIPQSRYISPMSLHVIADSKDQGWSSYPNEKGTRTSHTWGELRLSTQPFSRYLVFRNIHAGSTYELHDVSISLSGTGVDEQFILLAEQIRMAVGKKEDEHLVFIGFKIDCSHTKVYPFCHI